MYSYWYIVKQNQYPLGSQLQTTEQWNAALENWANHANLSFSLHKASTACAIVNINNDLCIS